MPQPIGVLVVTSPGCHYCEETLRLLDELAESRPMQISTMPLSSEMGRALLVRHRVPFPPILLVDGEFFGYGRISRRRLESHLERLTNGERVG